MFDSKPHFISSDALDLLFDKITYEPATFTFFFSLVLITNNVRKHGKIRQFKP